ncbi:hypoxanthine phosphoribosyltransferase [candidate division WOR_3 bacterium SM23_42]|jgi:hypoxanthine phosphoribosyltransferase|uniref:Hypoxanthine phosphoribosyltransferase n=1 Tax=candidate division WOR_3 bacterium SM23_42 TaxID=1703779 RepID=A0A0S8FTZ4_UNCW3|nr:MAG: hypoxanthine phosphoribosyltransferase [candidate division WOR_3 bacterium SM23_42]
MNVLIKEADIQKKVEEIGRQINEEYGDKKPILIGVLKGAFMFLADLLREIDIPLEVDFLSIHSYNGKESSGVVRITHDLSLNIEDRNVILVEDIIDSGRTVSYILENLRTRKPRSLVVCSLLSKESRRVVDVPLNYVGFTIPGVFVVGYGLDYDNRYRNLKYIGVLDDK